MREVHSHGHKTHVALEIRDFHPSDVGQYTCVASNAISREEGYIRVHEMVRVTAPPSPPPGRRTEAPSQPPPPPRRPPPTTRRPVVAATPFTRRPFVTSRRPHRPAVRPADGMASAAAAVGRGAAVTAVAGMAMVALLAAN